MPRFPRSEPDIAALALVVTQGLAQAPEDFPAPPVPADELQGRLGAYNAALSSAISTETAARERHAAKDDALEQLVDGVKATSSTPRSLCEIIPRNSANSAGVCRAESAKGGKGRYGSAPPPIRVHQRPIRQRQSAAP